MKRFANKVVLITGADTGIGLATVHRLHDEGAVVYAGILPKDTPLHPPPVTSLTIDVTDEAQWQAVIDTIAEREGRLDVLVNNAGIRESAMAENTSTEQWQRLLDTNLTGTFLGCRAAIPLMRESGGGAIVNVSSITGIRGVPNMVAYSASKSGIVAMTASLAIDHARDSIRVNAVCPGAIATDMLEAFYDDGAGERAEVMARTAANHPLGRVGRPEEVASVIAFLASDDASFMTGLAIPVDGGRSVR